MVIAPARTGSANSSNRVVINTDHTNRGICSKVVESLRILIVVVIKLMAPKMEEIPAKWSEKIVRSTADLLCAKYLDSGGYRVQPVPLPCSVIFLTSIVDKDGGSIQNLRLFKRGKAMSGEPNIIGKSQFPNPPINTGITKKKIITKAWEVTIVLYICSSKKLFLGCLSWIRIIVLIEEPRSMAQVPKIK